MDGQAMSLASIPDYEHRRHDVRKRIARRIAICGNLSDKTEFNQY